MEVKVKSVRKYIQSNQRKISYQVFGSELKYTLVLVHGFCEDASIWNSLLSDLQYIYKIIIPDLPGFGESDTWEGLTIADMAATVKYILDEESIYRPVMIGHSMGGYVTLAFEEKYPNTLQGFGLFHSTTHADSEEKKENRLKTIAFIREHGSEEFAKVLIPTLYAPNFDSQVIQQAVQIGATCSVDGLVNASAAMRVRTDLTPILNLTQVPVLIISGKYDAGIPVSVSATQAALPTCSTFEVLQQSGHCGMIEEPEKSLYIIQNFLNYCFNIYTHAKEN